MSKRKIVLSTGAILVGLAAVYLFFSASLTGLPSGTNGTSGTVPSSENIMETSPAGAHSPGGEEAVACETDIENTALRQIQRAAKPAQPPQVNTTFIGTAAELIFYLILIVAMVVGLLFVLKKIIPGSHRIFDSPAIEIIGKSHLSQKQAIYLAKLGRRLLVLGVAENSVNLLAEMDDADEINSIRAINAQGGKESVTNAFKSVFKRKQGELTAAGASHDKTVQGELDKIQSMVDDWEAGYSSLHDRQAGVECET